MNDKEDLAARLAALIVDQERPLEIICTNRLSWFGWVAALWFIRIKLLVSGVIFYALRLDF